MATTTTTTTLPYWATDVRIFNDVIQYYGIDPYIQDVHNEDVYKWMSIDDYRAACEDI